MSTAPANCEPELSIPPALNENQSEVSPPAAERPLSSAEIKAAQTSISSCLEQVPVPDPAAANDDDDLLVLPPPRDLLDDHPPYWHPPMAPLSARSLRALSRLRSFTPPPFPLWDELPVSCRAAVLILLYADRRGELRVVLTMRSASLRSFSGHAAFPGGKADSVHETPWQVARREAWEEIGLPLDDGKMPAGWGVEKLGEMPCHLAKTEVVVRPVVGLLRWERPTGDGGIERGDVGQGGEKKERPEPALLPKLDAKEVAAVFSAPLHNFLLAEDEVPAGRDGSSLPPGKWYEGSWTNWHEEPWRMHFFYVPVTDQRVTRPSDISTQALPSSKTAGQPNGNTTEPPSDQAAPQLAPAPTSSSTQDAAGPKPAPQPHPHIAESPAHVGRFKVWGLTARMLVDTATIAYEETPQFEHNTHFGDERMIEGLARLGRLRDKKKPGSVLTKEDVSATYRLVKGEGNGQGVKM